MERGKSVVPKRRYRFGDFPNHSCVRGSNSRNRPSTMPKRKARVQQCGDAAKKAGRKPTPLSQEQQDDLENDGFIILDYVREGGNISEQMRGNLIDIMLENGSCILNNSSDGTAGDLSRLMMSVEPCDIPGKLAMRVVRRLLRQFPFLKMGKAAYLSSLEHGHDQLPHIDVSNPDESLRAYVDRQMVPLSVIITYREPAILNVWRGSHKLVWASGRRGARKRCFGERIKVPPYSAIVFRQDLVHAGTSYDSPNLRLHLFLDLDVPDYSNDPTKIKLMDSTYFRMKAT